MNKGLSAAQRLSTIAQNALLETPSVGDSELQSSREPLTGPESIARGGIEAAEVSEVPGQDAQSETREKSISSPTLATMGTELGALDEESGEVNRDVVPFEDPADTQEQGQGSASGNHGRPLKPRRRKRISIVKPPKRRKRPSKSTESVEFDDQEPEEENLEPPTRVPSVPPGSQNRSKSTLATIEEELVDGYKPQEESAEEEWEDDKEAGKPAKQSENPHNRPPKQRRETAHSARRKPPTSPNKQAKRRRRGTVDSDAGSAEENGETQVRQRLRTRIPITVQRLYRPQALGSDNDEQGMLNDSTVFPRRKGVNGVDVLSQVCSELIAKAVDRLQQATDSGTNRVAKAELKRRKRVAMGFGEELENKLFDLVRLSLTSHHQPSGSFTETGHSLRQLTTIGRFLQD